VKATVNGVELFYEIHGDGEWLVLAHEFSGGYKSWQPQVDAFRKHHRVLVYNNRGYPPSHVPADPADYSQEHSIEDLRQLLARVGVEHPVLVGFSMGGSLVLNYALAYPAGIRALVLAGTGTGSIDKAQNARDFGPIADRFLTDGPAKVGDDYLRGPTRVQLLRKNPAAWQKLYAEFSELSPIGMAYTLRGVQLERPTMYELEPRLRTLRVPTLVLVGEEDAPALEPSRFLARTIVDATLKVLPKTGHTLQLEEPEAFNAAVLEFVRGLRARPALR
jgi:pimeloyl-ACP methyl ester carboxylesterase